MDFVVGVLILVLGLVVSIALHELGHLIPAKRFGVRVPQYMVGFGTTLWSRTVRGTEYGLKAVPLGGYVRLVGMYPPARSGTTSASPGVQGVAEGAAAHTSGRPRRTTLVEAARQDSLAEIRPGEEHRAFYHLTVPRKLVVMLGGPLMNLLIAAVLLTVVVAGLGLPSYTTTLGNVQQCLTDDPTATECSADDPVAPAAAAGLQPGDEVLSWAGTEVSSWEELSGLIAAGGTAPVDVVVLRDGERHTLQVSARSVDRPVVADGQYVENEDGEVVTEPTPFVGIGPTAALVPQPLSEVPGVVTDAVGETFQIVLTLPQRLVGIAQAVLGPEERDPGVMGLVGVGRFAGEITSVEGQGYGLAERSVDMLGLLASLNLALFVFNLIPLLPLDGGHVAGALWEGTRRTVARWRARPDPGPVDIARTLPVTYGVVVVMIGMSLFLAYADIVEPISLTG